MKRVIKIIFLSVLIQSIYSQRKCLIQNDHCYAANDENYICEGDVQEGCVAIPRCENAGKGETDCQNYPVSKDKSGNCILSNGSCKQRLFCEYNNEENSDWTCRDYQISPPNDGKVCVLKSQGYGCEAKFKCESVPNSESESCSSFPVEDKNYVNAKTCINDSSGTKKCKEEYYCGKESPSQSNDEGCKNYATSDSNKICVFEGSGCTEKLLCTYAQGDQVSDSNCPLYTPSFEKRATYSCVKNPDKNECVEQTSCPFVSGNNINCENYPVTNANKNTHACVSNPEGPSACKEELLCSQTNTENLTADQCRLHPISNRENKENYLCVPKSDNTGCEEKLKCEAVTDLGNNDCSDFPTTDQINKGCTDNTGGNTACKEQIFCTKATQGNTNEECMDYPVTDNTKYICLKNDEENSPCKEVELCDTIIGENLIDSDCLKYPVSKKHQSTHTCIKDPYNNKCMEQFFCNSGPLKEGLNCSNYIVSKENQSTHYCINDPTNNKCMEQFICEFVSNYTEKEVNCSNYPVRYEHENTHICIYDFANNSCKEHILCEAVPNNTIDVDCSIYPVVLENNNTHACVSNTEGSTICKEIEICPVMNNENLTDQECRIHPISERENKSDYLCVLNLNNTVCEEKLKCEAVKNLGFNECSDFPTTDERKVCIEKRGKNSICEEQFICLKANQNESNEECMNYIVSDNTKFICLKNDEGNSSCKEVELCDTIIGENLTDSDCLEYPVSKDHQSTHTCIKDPYKNKCMEQFFCNSVPKYICSNYPVTIGNEITHYCSENPNGDTPCQEIEIPTSSELSNESDELNTNTNTILIEEFQSTILDLGENTTNSTIETTNTTLTTLIVLLGFSNFVMAKKSFTFNTHFIPLTGSLYSKKLIFSASIIYNNNYFRQLEDSNFECNLSKNNAQSSTNYLCEVQIQNKDIKQIKLLTNFMFTSQDKVLLTGITPIAKMSLNNINKIDTKFNNLLLSNPPIFILDNCTISNNYEDRKLNISGTIKGNKPKSVIVNNSLALMINIEDDANELSREIKCIVISMKNYNYTLDCELYSKGIYNYQSALSIINDGILVINFDNIINENEKALVNYEPEDVKPNIKKSKRISTGAIVGIILGSLALLAGIIIAIIFIRKKNKKEIKNENPSIQQLKILRVD